MSTVTAPSFLHVFWELNSGPNVHEADTLPSEPFPAPASLHCYHAQQKGDSKIRAGLQLISSMVPLIRIIPSINVKSINQEPYTCAIYMQNAPTSRFISLNSWPPAGVDDLEGYRSFKKRDLGGGSGSLEGSLEGYSTILFLFTA